MMSTKLRDKIGTRYDQTLIARNWWRWPVWPTSVQSGHRWVGMLLMKAFICLPIDHLSIFIGSLEATQKSDRLQVQEISPTLIYFDLSLPFLVPAHWQSGWMMAIRRNILIRCNYCFSFPIYFHSQAQAICFGSDSLGESFNVLFKNRISLFSFWHALVAKKM